MANAMETGRTNQVTRLLEEQFKPEAGFEVKPTQFYHVFYVTLHGEPVLRYELDSSQWSMADPRFTDAVRKDALLLAVEQGV